MITDPRPIKKWIGSQPGVSMEAYQRQFIERAIEAEALRFGEFTLKSGRTSPYFFNAGRFSSGRSLAVLGRCYAEAIVRSGIDFDILFGPAYKGIPLAAVTAVALAEHHGRDTPYCYNRKEAKDHGEGGTLVGAPLEGRVLIIDDVITAGTAIREVMEIIDRENARAAGVVIGVNRREQGKNGLSAIAEVENEFGIPVVSIITIDHIIGYLEDHGGERAILAAIKTYRDKYGA